MSMVSVVSPQDGFFVDPKMLSIGFGGKSIRFVYNNNIEKEAFSKVYAEDTISNRTNFLNLLAKEGYIVPMQSAIGFGTMFLDDSVLYAEFV